MAIMCAIRLVAFGSIENFEIYLFLQNVRTKMNDISWMIIMTKRRHQNLHLQSLTISFLNVCSIRYKLDEIRDFIASRGVSIFAVAETS